MQTDESYVLASCPKCGEMWLEQTFYTPATRWEPEDFEVNAIPCPKCGNEDDIGYAETTPYGGFAKVALECALIVADAIEWWHLPNCTRCGKKAWEGGTMCPICVQKAADEYFARSQQRCPNCGNEEVQFSHNTLSFYCQPCDQWFDEPEEERRL